MEKIYHIADVDYNANLLSVEIDGSEGTVIVLSGIGETVKTFSANWAKMKENIGKVLANPIRSTMEAIDNYMVKPMQAKAEERKLNIVAVCTYHQYTAAEMDAAEKYARQKLGSKYVWYIVHSQGGCGYGIAMNEARAASSDANVWIAPGNCYTTAGLAALGKSKTPNWFITSNLDTQVAGDLGQTTENMHKQILANGGVSFMTLYDDTSVGNEHSIWLDVINNPAKWPAQGNAAKPTLDIIDWLMSNAKGKQITAPDGVFNPVANEETPAPPVVVVDPVPEVPPVVITPPANKIEILFVLQNYSDREQSRHTSVHIHWADDTVQHVDDIIPAGYRNAGTWENKKMGTYTLDIKNIETGEAGKKIIIGPYKQIS
jgi:hypothetical protein